MINKETGEVKTTNSEVLKIGGGISLIILSLFWIYPTYNVWSSKKQGESQLAHATFSKQVAVEISKAKWESASWEAGADTVTAHGVARANEIIGNSLKNNEAYLYFKWLQTLQDMKGEGQVIYLPGGSFPNLELPITEANRLQKKSVVQAEEK